MDAEAGPGGGVGRWLKPPPGGRALVPAYRRFRDHVPKAAQAMVAALVRTIFVQPDMKAARAELARVAENVDKRFPRAAELLRDAEDDILVYVAFPAEHWRQTSFTPRLGKAQP